MCNSSSFAKCVGINDVLLKCYLVSAEISQPVTLVSHIKIGLDDQTKFFLMHVVGRRTIPILDHDQYT